MVACHGYIWFALKVPWWAVGGSYFSAAQDLSELRQGTTSAHSTGAQDLTISPARSLTVSLHRYIPSRRRAY